MRMLGLALALVLPCATAVLAAETASVRILPGREDVAWVGEEVPIHLELWTSAFSFSNQSFLLPEVAGAYLLQADTSTVKLGERREGVSWQGLRYTFSLYPQRPGVLEIPPFDVRFSTRAAFDQEPVPHRFTTAAVTVESRLPPGVAAGGLVVSTRDFRLQATWTPAPTDGVLEMQTGDAVVLTVRREADNVPGMVLTPLPPLEVEGLGVYADAPAVRDRVNRGDLKGMRTDRVTVIGERPGSYTLPALAFEWWDPVDETLHRETVPAVRLDVAENAAWGSPAPADSGEPSPLGPGTILWLVAAGLLLWWPGWPLLRRSVRWLTGCLAPRRLSPLNPGASRSSSR